ncbi:ORF6C domain-containing protein [Brevibacillus sp. HB1.4B]|uniref:ORF6C domain-containing protein n=1 Tax=Brevibacillus sp. HB1.4B TaxID=2738845 RepID=UPI00156AEAFB|nr:ORF6C domain-containing protein [Brevibacillus sp. HB1.4B]NRS20643.1 ORF6C domain-containing protein [Brevibacillus sp. HB1.4B]
MNEIQVIQHNEQRVLTTAQLADSYGTTSDKISYNFNYNERRYQKGKHFFLLDGEDLKSFKKANREFQGSINKLYLWTEKGAWLHAKSLNTDEAWEAYETLVDDYYRVKGEQLNLSPEVKAIFFLDKKTQEIETRVEKLEDNMTIDYGQQLSLQKVAKNQILTIVGGKETPAYQNKPLRDKLFSSIWSDYKEYFNVGSYRDTALKDCDRAKEYLKQWAPQGKLLREVEEANQQLTFAS